MADDALGNQQQPESATIALVADLDVTRQPSSLQTAVVAFIDYMVTGHIEPEPTRRGVFSMEITAFVLLLAAFVSGEVVNMARPGDYGKHAGLTFRDVGLVPLRLFGSLSEVLDILAERSARDT